MKLKISRVAPDAILPEYATSGASAFDLFVHTVGGSRVFGSHVDEGGGVLVGTGIRVEVPDGWVLVVNSRSGAGFRYGVRLANSQGWIDSDYRGEVMVMLTADREATDELGMFVRPFDRVAQAMLIQAPRVEFEVVGELSKTERGSRGLGSTGA